MKKKAKTRHSVDFLFIMFIFLIFVFSVISSLFLGINFYKSTVDMSDKNSDSRVAVAYIRELVRQNDKENAISIGTFDGRECLMIEPQENYVIYVYQYNDELKELYARKDANLKAADGKTITQIESLKFDLLGDNMLSVVLKDKNGEFRTLLIGLKSKMGER